ncbi:MAG: MBL fold metallo-hydrolase [Hyphomonadaceae bacterium]|nr:MBL fold metallo-hydrolase [Hyphomonadaceae bacterium]
MNPNVASFLHAPTGTYTHVVSCPVTRRAAIIDSVQDYDAPSGTLSTKSADAVIAHARAHDLKVDWLLETHIHADHLSAAPYLKHVLGGQVGVGAKIGSVQDTWNGRFNLPEPLRTQPGLFDHLFTDNEPIPLGEVAGRALDTPGHTAMDVTYLFGDAAFIGDTLFAPDYGVARTDFPGGKAETLYHSIVRILALPENTRLFLCHDYLPADGSRGERRPETSIAGQRGNLMWKDYPDEASFAAMRRERDKPLTPPVLLFPSLQVNIRAGEAPPPEANGVAYLKIPLRRG